MTTNFQLNRIRWLTFFIFSGLVILYQVLKLTLNTLGFGRILSFFFALVISLVLAGIALYHIFLVIYRKFLEMSILEEKVKESVNLLEKTKQELEEKNLMHTRRVDELKTLGKITHTMTSTMELDKILQIILEGVHQDLGFDRAMVCLINEQSRVIEGAFALGIGDELVKKFHFPLKNKDNFIIRTLNQVRPYIISQAEQDAFFFQVEKDEDFKIYKEIYAGLSNRDSGLALVPLVSRDKVIGLIMVDNLESNRPIEEKDLRSLVTFTDQAGLAIENARLYNTERRFNEELQRQVDIAVKKLEEAQAELIQAERLSALGEMAAVVAHEVRNPMASIRASAQRIDQKIGEEDPSKKYVRFIIGEVDRLSRIVREMLVFTRQPEPVFKETSMNQVLEETLAFMDDEIIKNEIKLVKELPADLPLIPLDEALLKQVFLNIIQNAVSFMQKRENKELKISTARANGRIQVRISDTGTGIPPENIAKIFEPFFSTKSQGTGLGLAICRRIIDSHRGEISVESEIGKGTTFILFLPLRHSS